MVERGTLPGSARVVDTLAGIAARVEAEGIRPPAITLVGPVAGLRETIAWLERRPLHGEVVAVTRARAQASGLAARLRELGAEVVETPAIRIEPRPLEGELLDAVRAHRRVRARLPHEPERRAAALRRAGARPGRTPAPSPARPSPPSARAPPPSSSGTAIRADVVPERFVAEALVEALEPVAVEGRRVLVARAAEARDVLPDALRERGAEVDDVALYETVAEPLGDAERAALERATYVTFTSSSTVRFLLESGARPPDGRAHGLDRPGDERDRRRSTA